MFKKAERKASKLKIAITGPSGSGKTMSALLIAKGMGGKVAVIDTENGSASLYADKFDFDTVELGPPFSHDKYIGAIEAAEKGGYNIIVIDSFSHAWAGEGGVLDQKATLDQNPKSNQFANWKNPKDRHNKLKNAILHSSCHIICSIRSKTSYEQQVEDGRKKIEKMGLEPISEPGMEYEFSIVFEMQMSHTTIISKDRTSLFDGKIFQPSEKTGKEIMEWHSSGKSVWKFGEKELADLKKICASVRWDGAKMRQECKALFEGRIETQLNEEEFKKLCHSIATKAVEELVKDIESHPAFEQAVSETPDPRQGK